VEDSGAKRKAEMCRQLDRSYAETSRRSKNKVEKAYKGRAVTEANINFFENAGLEREDAECCVYALSFYTGAGSADSSRAGSLKVRKSNALVAKSTQQETESFLKDHSHILYFLSLALRTIPYYWGTVTRFVSMSDEAAQSYAPGHVITWMQFASSSVLADGPTGFKHRNCKFVVYSIKGRMIQQFSNYAKEEKEVLFMPFTRLLVLRVDVNGTGKKLKYIIHCREVELAITHGLPLLWVDDRIHEPDEEMKKLMENAMARAGREIKFILKPSTELALAFLRSWFGQRAMANDKFRIITDMSRPAEDEGDTGANSWSKLGEIRTRVTGAQGPPNYDLLQSRREREGKGIARLRPQSGEDQGTD